MSIIAFLYQPYSENGSPRSNFKGHFHDINQLKEVLKGNRYDYSLMDTLNLETLEWRQYHWRPLYKVEEVRNPDRSYPEPMRYKLKHRFDDSLPELEIVYDGVRGYALQGEIEPGREHHKGLHYGQGSVYEEAGSWEEGTEDSD
jgi:hypothetical protein